MTRREFLSCYFKEIAGIVVFGCVPQFSSAGRGLTYTFRVRRNGNVLSETSRQVRVRLRGELVTAVGLLQGDLHYLVNGRLPLCSARRCLVRPGDIISWREV